MELYLIKSSLALLFLFLGYELVLRRDTFFVRNRIYLVSAMLLSFLLPLIPLIPTPSFVHPSLQPRAEAGLLLVNGVLQEKVSNGSLLVTTDSHFQPENLLLIFYLAGMFFMLIRFFNQGWYMLRLLRCSKSKIISGKKFFFHRETVSHFSFFHYVFINERLIEEGQNDLQKILDHERVHVNQYHSLDILFCELSTILFWFNPLIWIYRKRIQENHEFIADHQVLSSGYGSAEYQATLVNQALGIPVFSLTNKFNQVHLKKRIAMLRKIKSSPRANLKLFMLIPFLAAVLTLSGWKSRTVEYQADKLTIHGKVIDNESRNPLEGASVIIVNTTEGTVSNAAGEFTIMVDPGHELAISFVGFETSLIKINDDKTILARLNKKSIALDDVGVSPLTEKDQGYDKSSVIFFLNGKETTADEVAKLDPGKIAQTTVLKGESAINKYGERGKNGVVEIELKETGSPIKTNNEKPHDTIRDNSETYTVVEELPQFPGGNDAFRDYINNNLKYPEIATKNLIQGKVFVSFAVGTEGAVKKVQVVRGVDPSLDAEAVRVISASPLWKPGSQKGKPIEVSFTIPVDFKLDQNGPVYSEVDESPQFQNGEMDQFGKYLAEHIVYPEHAKKNKITGKVFVQFIVSPLGKVNDVKVVRGVAEELDSEAVRVIQSSPDWIPGKKAGKNVAVQFTIPVTFALK